MTDDRSAVEALADEWESWWPDNHVGDVPRGYAKALRDAIAADQIARDEQAADLASAYDIGCRDGSIFAARALGVKMLSVEMLNVSEAVEEGARNNPYLTPGAETFMQEFEALVNAVERLTAERDKWRRAAER